MTNWQCVDGYTPITYVMDPWHICHVCSTSLLTWSIYRSVHIPISIQPWIDRSSVGGEDIYICSIAILASIHRSQCHAFICPHATSLQACIYFAFRETETEKKQTCTHPSIFIVVWMLCWQLFLSISYASDRHYTDRFVRVYMYTFSFYLFCMPSLNNPSHSSDNNLCLRKNQFLFLFTKEE